MSTPIYYTIPNALRAQALLTPRFNASERSGLDYWLEMNLDNLMGFVYDNVGGGGGGAVNSVTGTLPVVATGTTNVVISMAAAGAGTDGYLTSVNWNTFNSKQELLVSGVNIKTINGESLLGSGNIVITGGGTSEEEVQDIVATMLVAGSNVLLDYDDTANQLTISSTASGGGSYAAIPNHGIEIIGSEIGTAYNTLIADTVNSVAVGGAPSLPASTWKTKNLVEVMDTILFPDQLPTYTIPTITFSSSITGTREIGEVISPVLTTVGSENDAGVFSTIFTVRNTTVINTNNAPTQNTIADIAAQFGYVDPNNPNRSYTSAYTDTSFTVPAGSTTWNGRGSYALGLAKKNNKGVTDVRAAAVRSVNAPQAADAAFNSTTVTITGIYPYFWGKSTTQPTAASIAAAIGAGTATRELIASTGTVTVTYNAASEYIWVAIPAANTDKTKWYFTELNQGAIGAGQLILAPVIQNVNSPQSRWTSVPYDIYISGYATSTTGAMEYRNA